MQRRGGTEGRREAEDRTEQSCNRQPNGLRVPMIERQHADCATSNYDLLTPFYSPLPPPTAAEAAGREVLRRARRLVDKHCSTQASWVVAWRHTNRCVTTRPPALRFNDGAFRFLSSLAASRPCVLALISPRFAAAQPPAASSALPLRARG